MYHRICALTLYRVYVTSSIVADNAKERYALIALLTSLEALLGVISACLPVMKPALVKIRGGLSKSDDSSIKTFMTDRVPRLLRLRHTWDWSVGKDTADSRQTPSPKPSEGSWMKEGAGLAPKVERVIGMRVAEIYVRNDVDVESTLSDEHMPLGKTPEGRHDRW